MTPKTAVLYGDSLTWESRGSTKQQFKKEAGWTHTVRALPATAPCDWLKWLPADLATHHPAVVGITSAGNASKCVSDANGNVYPIGSPGYFSQYRRDINAMFALITRSGARAVWIEAPPMLDKTRKAATKHLTNIAWTLALDYWGVSIATAPRASVSRNGKYAARKTCLAKETAAAGCDATSKTIPIRTLTGGQTGLNFCPGGLGASRPWSCKGYSSGANRWGRSVANALVRPPKFVSPYVGLATGPKVIGIGDSITDITFKATDRALAPSYQVWTRSRIGIVGEVLIPTLQDQLRSNPDIAIIEAGADDALWSYQNWRSDFDAIISAVSSLHCVEFVTIPKTADYYGTINNGVQTTIARDWNAALVDAVASHPNFHLIDWNAQINAAGISNITTDGIHPNQVGRAWFVNAYRSALATDCT